MPPRTSRWRRTASSGVPIARMRSRERRHRLRDRRRRLEPEDDAADVALVEEARRDRLGHQRVAQALGRGRGLGGRDLLDVGEVDAGGAQHRREVRRRRASSGSSLPASTRSITARIASPRSRSRSSTVPRGRRRQRP